GGLEAAEPALGAHPGDGEGQDASEAAGLKTRHGEGRVPVVVHADDAPEGGRVVAIWESYADSGVAVADAAVVRCLDGEGGGVGPRAAVPPLGPVGDLLPEGLVGVLLGGCHH